VARLALLFALALPLTASASTSSFRFFQTPSHNIGCAYSSSPESLRCDIRTGLKPPPAKPKGCMNDWTFGYEMSLRGPSRTVCAGDTVFSPDARVIGYGQTVRYGHFTCKSGKSGLLCSNSTRHGFFLSQAHSYRFQPFNFIRFRTPSGQIGCEYFHRGQRFLRCDINGGLKPRPPKPKSCEFEWAVGYSLPPTRPAQIVCASDTVNNPAGQKTLGYGTTWRGGVFSCVSQRTGLRCANTRGQGFFLSKQHSYRF
jgi:uncharacterized protein DUF6636